MNRTADEITAAIKTVDTEIQKLAGQQQRLQKHKKELQMELLFAEYGLRQGSMVRSKGNLFQVVSVDSWWHPNKPWLTAKKIKKDGTPSQQIQTIFRDWEVDDE